MNIEHAGVALQINVDGPVDGPPILFLHGIGSCAQTYDFLVDELPAHRLHRVDFRGHGASGRTPGQYALGDYVQDAVGVLEQSIGGRAVVVGHSLGGLTATLLAQRRPDLVTAVFLEDPPLFFGDPATYAATSFPVVFSLIKAAIDSWQESGTSAADIAAAVGTTPSMSGQGALGDEITPDGLAAFGAAFATVDTGVYDTTGESLRELDPQAPIPVPGIVLHGERALSGALFEEHAALIASINPHIEVIGMSGVGHLIHDSRSHRVRYSEQLHRFLDRYAPA